MEGESIVVESFMNRMRQAEYLLGTSNLVGPELAGDLEIIMELAECSPKLRMRLRVIKDESQVRECDHRG
jgi:hypothetical protein